MLLWKRKQIYQVKSGWNKPQPERGPLGGFAPCNKDVDKSLKQNERTLKVVQEQTSNPVSLIVSVNVFSADREIWSWAYNVRPSCKQQNEKKERIVGGGVGVVI